MGARTKANISDFSAGVNNTSTPILPAYFGRNFLQIKNNGPGACAVNLLGGTATAATKGNVQLASGQQLLFQKNVPQNAISAISASTSQLTVYSDDSLALPSFLFSTTPAPAVDLNFKTGQYWLSPNTVSSISPFLTVTRAQASAFATDLLPTSAQGASFNTFAANTPRLTPGVGLLIEEARTNLLLNSTAPATQTTGALGVATFNLWVNGSGSAQASVGTATAPSLPQTATQGNPISFAVTVGGTVVITVAGSLNAFQLEQGVGASGTFGTSLIITAGATVTRPIDTIVLTPSPVPGASSSVYWQGIPFAVSTFTAGQQGLSISDGTAANRFGPTRLASTGIGAGANVIAGVASIPTSSALHTTGTSGKYAYATANADQVIVFNNSNIGTTAGSWPPASALNVCAIGSITTLGLPWNGYCERFAIWPYNRLDTATLQRITI